MPGVNLTRDEASTRSTLVKTHSYRIDLDLTTSAETFIAKTTVKFSGLKPGASTFIDAVGKRVLSAKLNGVAFEGIRYVDVFIIKDGLITEQHVWNDFGESGVLN